MENFRSTNFSAYVRGLIEDASPRVTYLDSNKYVLNYTDDDVVNTMEDAKDLALGDTSHVSILAPNGDAVAITTSVGY